MSTIFYLETWCFFFRSIAPRTPQPETGATYDPFLNKDELCKIDLTQSAVSIHNFIRGLDSVPGAWIILDGKKTKVEIAYFMHITT